MINPLYDRVVVKPSEAQTTTSGGLLIPEQAREKALKGVVLAVGNGYRHEQGTLWPLTVGVGDEVLLPERGGTEVVVNGTKLVILREEEILGVLNKGEDS